MTTQCNATKLTFHELDSREVMGRFDGGEITSDAGGLLLREVEKHTRILGRMSSGTGRRRRGGRDGLGARSCYLQCTMTALE